MYRQSSNSSLANWDNYPPTSEPRDHDAQTRSNLELGVSDGNAHLSIGNYYGQQALGDPWSDEAPDNTFQQDNFDMPLIPPGRYLQPSVASQASFEPPSTHHSSPPEIHHQFPPEMSIPHHTLVPSSSARETYRHVHPLSKSQRTSKGKGRESMGVPPPMHSHLGAEGMQGPSGIAAVEGDEDDGSNGDGGGNDKAAQGMVMQIDGADDIGPNGVFKSIAWWTSHHSEDGGLALIREFQLVVEEVLINQCFPSFRRNSRFEVDLGRLLDLARRRFEEKNKGQRALYIHPEKLRELAISHVGHARDQNFSLIVPVFTTHYGFVQGTWEELPPATRFHNLQLMHQLVGSREFAILNKISKHPLPPRSPAPQLRGLDSPPSPLTQVYTYVEFFSSPGYQEALKLMLPSANAIDALDGLMPHSYYSFVGVCVLRGAIGFGYCFGPEKYYRFRAGVWGNPFKVLYGFAKKHIVGPDWDAHRKYLYTASRDAPPVCEDYQLPAELPF